MLSVCTLRFEDRFCTSRRGGIGEEGGCHPPGDSAWQLLQLAVEKLPSPCRGSVSGTVGSFQSERVSSGQRTLTIECLLTSGCGQGRELAKKI